MVKESRGKVNLVAKIVCIYKYTIKTVILAIKRAMCSRRKESTNSYTTGWSTKTKFVK